MIKMIKKIKESRWWYNFKDSVKFYYEMSRGRGRGTDEGDKAMEDLIKEDAKINKLMGLPPPDKFAEKNPYRFM